ncbi:hypothetical protein JZ751_021512, partial [Albula glossodonta]
MERGSEFNSVTYIHSVKDEAKTKAMKQDMGDQSALQLQKTEFDILLNQMDCEMLVPEEQDHNITEPENLDCEMLELQRLDREIPELENLDSDILELGKQGCEIPELDQLNSGTEELESLKWEIVSQEKIDFNIPVRFISVVDPMSWQSPEEVKFDGVFTEAENSNDETETKHDITELGCAGNVEIDLEEELRIASDTAQITEAADAESQLTHVKDYLCCSVFTAVCCNCFCLGFIALILSIKARRKMIQGEVPSAQRYSSRAQRTIVSAILVTAIGLMVFILVMVFIGEEAFEISGNIPDSSLKRPA